MSEKAKNSKRKERGLNVRVTQEKKITERNDVHVNSYFEKNDPKKKADKTATTKNKTKKTADKTIIAKKKNTVAKKKTAAKKTATKNSIAGEKVGTTKAEPTKIKEAKIEKIEAKEIKAEEAKVEAKIEEPKIKEVKTEETKAEETKAEETKAEVVKAEVKEPASFSKSVKVLNEAKKPEVILPNKVTSDEDDSFETLSLNAAENYTSRIIPRDVTRNRDEIEHPKTLVSTFKPEKAEENEKATAPVFRRRVVRSKKLSAKEIKEQEIKKAISTASRLPQNHKKRASRGFGNLGWARLTLMITCITTAVFALVYFVNLASNDVSLKVAATQSGIDATYPNYVPRGYELSDVTSASGKVTMNFKSEDGSFMITEEASNWNSDALLNNYIKENYDEGTYSVVVEQGLTIYMGTNWEAWVNGGLLYKLNVKTGSLTKKQLKTIATSL